MDDLILVAEKVGEILNSEGKLQAGKCIINKRRTLTIFAEDRQFSCTLDFDISFKQLRQDGTATNRAEVFLLPEEVPVFLASIRQYPIALPTKYSQHMTINPNIVSVYMESREIPEHFAKRLSSALAILEQQKAGTYSNK